MSIGNRIKKLRIELGFTQAQLAKEINIKPSQLGRYETNMYIPSVKTLVKLADFLEVSLDYLITGKDSKLINKAGFQDKNLLDILRQVASLKKPARDKIKWTLEAMLDKQVK